MGHNQAPLRRLYRGNKKGRIIGFAKGDTRSLDYSSHGVDESPDTKSLVSLAVQGGTPRGIPKNPHLSFASLVLGNTPETIQNHPKP